MILRCKDDPEANQRQPAADDVRYTLLFPLEDGTTLTLHMGQEGHATFAAMIAQMMIDDSNGATISTPME